MAEADNAEAPKKSGWGSYFGAKKEDPGSEESASKTSWSDRLKAGKDAVMAKATELNNSDRAAWLKAKMGTWSVEAKKYMTSDSFKAAAAAIAAGAAALYSKELLDFMQNPTAEALQANPQLLFELSTMLNEIQHPSAALYHATLNQAMKAATDGGDGIMGAAAATGAMAAVSSGAASNAMSKVVQQQTGVAVDSSTLQAGLDMLPPDLIKQAVNQISPEQIFDLMKLVAKSQKT